MSAAAAITLAITLLVGELVASFASRPNLLKYEQKTQVCAASPPLKRTGKTYGDHAHAVPRSAAASDAFF